MNKSKRNGFLFGLVTFAVGMLAGVALDRSNVAIAQSPDQVFELRTYTTHPGKLNDLHNRFSQHTIGLFERHGMTNVGYFTPQDQPLADNTLVYLLAHEDRDAAKASWQAFIDDPEWQEVYRDSRADGPIIESLESVFMNPTDYSQMR